MDKREVISLCCCVGNGAYYAVAAESGICRGSNAGEPITAGQRFCCINFPKRFL